MLRKHDNEKTDKLTLKFNGMPSVRTSSLFLLLVTKMVDYINFFAEVQGHVGHH
jgi:hypothetical protein